MTDFANLLNDLLRSAQQAGASGVDALLVKRRGLDVRQRQRQLNGLEAAESADLGLRLFIGKRQALVSSTDISPANITMMIDRAIAMAKQAPEDPFCGLADPTQLRQVGAPPNNFDPTEPTAAQLIELTTAAEDAALSTPGITNSDKVDAGWTQAEIFMAQSNGFVGYDRRSSYHLSLVTVAGSGTAMERDYEGCQTVFWDDLDDPVTLGHQAAARALRRLNARKMPTGKFPVVFDPRTANSLISHLASAMNGASVARGTSFLKDRLGQQIFDTQLHIIDDPHRHRGLRSRAFDAEGLATKPHHFVESGRLTGWLMDLRAARQLGMAPTGHASRSTSGTPTATPSNLYLAAGTTSPGALIQDIQQGFYVTELIGMGVNLVTGDYSRGATGLWIENGQITHPVNEMTIAGNLHDMFRNMTAADDLIFRYGCDAPTVRIDGMTVAGV